MKSLEHTIREIVSRKKKTVKEEEPVIQSEMNLPLGTDKYQGSQFKQVTPHIKPPGKTDGHSQEPENVSAQRNKAKAERSATMKGTWNEQALPKIDLSNPKHYGLPDTEWDPSTVLDPTGGRLGGGASPRAGKPARKTEPGKSPEPSRTEPPIKLPGGKPSPIVRPGTKPPTPANDPFKPYVPPTREKPKAPPANDPEKITPAEPATTPAKPAGPAPVTPKPATPAAPKPAVPAPAPSPAPKPVTAPAPVKLPDIRISPKKAPATQPAPAIKPATEPTPAPEPVKLPDINIQPQKAPVPSTTPKSDATPSTTPAAAPSPATAPAPAPAPAPASTPTPTTKGKDFKFPKFSLPGAGIGSGDGYKWGEHRPVGTTTHRAMKHKVNEEQESKGTMLRRKVVNVGRPCTAPSNLDYRSKLAKQSEIKTKIIDEAKKIAGIVKDTVKEKKMQDNDPVINGGKTVVYPQVIINPPIKAPDNNRDS